MIKGLAKYKNADGLIDDIDISIKKRRAGLNVPAMNACDVLKLIYQIDNNIFDKCKNKCKTITVSVAPPPPTHSGFTYTFDNTFTL